MARKKHTYPGPKLTPAQQRKLAKVRKEWDKKFAPMIEGIREAGRITEHDLNIRVGPCEDD